MTRCVYWEINQWRKFNERRGSGDFTPKDVDLFQELQWAYAKRMVTRPLKESFILEQPKAYTWPESSCPDFGKRKDNDYKNTPEK